MQHVPSCQNSAPSTKLEDPQKQPSITRSILPICRVCGLSSFRGRITCLRAILHVSPLDLWPILPPPSFRIQFTGCSRGALMLSFPCRWSSATATGASNRSFLSQNSPDQGRQRITSSSPAPGSLLRSFQRVMLWHSLAEAGHVVMRHFFHWPGHTV
jgi:hypothetical protein